MVSKVRRGFWFTRPLFQGREIPPTSGLDIVGKIGLGVGFELNGNLDLLDVKICLQLWEFFGRDGANDLVFDGAVNGKTQRLKAMQASLIGLRHVQGCNDLNRSLFL